MQVAAAAEKRNVDTGASALRGITGLARTEVPLPTRPTIMIEQTPNTIGEHCFVKYPGQLIEVTDYEMICGMKVFVDLAKLTKARRRGGSYTSIHTHVSDITLSLWDLSKKENRKQNGMHSAPEYISRTTIQICNNLSALPSCKDFEHFLKESSMGTIVIALRNVESGEVMGYNFIKKTKKTPKWLHLKDVIHGTGKTEKRFGGIIKASFGFGNLCILLDLNRYEDSIRKMFDGARLSNEAMERFTKKYHMLQKFVPTKRYKLNDCRTTFMREN